MFQDGEVALYHTYQRAARLAMRGGWFRRRETVEDYLGPTSSMRTTRTTYGPIPTPGPVSPYDPRDIILSDTVALVERAADEDGIEGSVTNSMECYIAIRVGDEDDPNPNIRPSLIKWQASDRGLVGPLALRPIRASVGQFVLAETDEIQRILAQHPEEVERQVAATQEMDRVMRVLTAS